MKRNGHALVWQLGLPSGLLAALVMVLGISSCSKEELLAPESLTADVTMSIQLGSGVQGSPLSTDLAPAAIVRVEVVVNAPGMNQISASSPIVAGSATLHLTVPQRGGLVFTIRARDGADRSQYEWTSPAVDLTGQKNYELKGPGGGAIVLEPVPPSRPNLSGSARGPYIVDLSWTASTAPDFASYRVYGGMDTPVPIDADHLVWDSASAGDNAIGVSVYYSLASYWFKVLAVDTEGLVSESNEVQVDTPSAWDLSYDDGSYEGTLNLRPYIVYSEAWVFFGHPYPTYAYRLGGIYFHVFKSPDAAARVRAVVYDVASGDEIFRGEEIFIDRQGVFEICLEGYGIDVYDDFVAGIEVLDMTFPGPGYFGLALDTDSDAGRAYVFTDLGGGDDWTAYPIYGNLALGVWYGESLGLGAMAKVVGAPMRTGSGLAGPVRPSGGAAPPGKKFPAPLGGRLPE